MAEREHQQTGERSTASFADVRGQHTRTPRRSTPSPDDLRRMLLTSNRLVGGFGSVLRYPCHGSY